MINSCSFNIFVIFVYILNAIVDGALKEHPLTSV